MADELLTEEELTEILEPLEDNLLEPLESDDSETRQSIAEQLNTALNTSQRLFIVDSTMDLTSYIVVPSYKVNLVDGYDDWKDMNKTDHRDTNSRKAQGSFSLQFPTLEEYQAFIIVMKDSKKSNGSYDCSVFCNNTLSCINVEMYIDFDPPNIMPYIGAKTVDDIEVTVNQRGNQYVWSQ